MWLRGSRRRATEAVEAALEQVGAGVAGRARGGDLYALNVEPEEGVYAGHDRDELLANVREVARSAVGWSDEEFQYQLRKRCRIDASLAEVRAARLELDGAAA